MLRAFVLSLCIAVCLLAADVTGTWKFTVETDQGSGDPTFTLKQNGEQLTGTYSGLFGKRDITGSVKGDKIEIRFQAEMQGQSFEIKYSGTIESATRMKGAVDLGGMASGTWTAAKE
jgi:hypothetical protein